jgi:hypothetical protein
MSLYGYSNSGFNNTLSGVLNITDGLGTEITNGNITTGNIDGNNVYLEGSLSSIGSNTINEFSNGISITSSTANIDLSVCQGIKATSGITISPIEISYLDNCSSNIQTQINSLATSSDVTILTAEVDALQTNTTGISYDAINNATEINNSLLRVYGNITFSTNLNSISSTVFSYLSGVTSNIQTQFNSITQRITNMTYSAGNTFFNSNVYVNTLNNITSLQISMLGDLTTTQTVETRFYALENARTTYWDPFFAFVDTPAPSGKDISFSTTYMHLGQNIDCSGNITFGSSSSINGISNTVLNYLSGCSANIQSSINSIVSSINSINQKLTKLSYNSVNDFTDLTSNLGVYGNVNFTGSINSISNTTFSYISFLNGVTSSIQDQLNSLVSSISSINTNLSSNYVDKSSIQTITGQKTFDVINTDTINNDVLVNGIMSTNRITFTDIDTTFQKRTLSLTDGGIINTMSSYPTPVYYNTTPATMSENLPNMCYVSLTSGCTSFTVASLSEMEDEGKTFILSNRTLASITINSPYPSSFIGLVGDGVTSWNLPPYSRAIICNNGSFWDVLHLTSYYDWSPGVYMLGSGGSFDSSILISYSCEDLQNLYSQPNTSSSLTSSDRQDFGVSVAGSYDNMNCNDNMDGAIVFPNWGCVVYQGPNYTSNILLNYKNSTKNPVCVKCSTTNVASSIKVYYFDQMLGYL